ncbi:hypothetical protein N2152v2_000430 [Parachlorella kessleri]
MEDPLGLRAKPRGKPGRKKRTSVLCQVNGCGEELLGAKHYYLRYRICRQHSVEPCLLIGDRQQRFCQQCGRFHLLSAFQGNQRSCKDKLKRHKARRRGGRGGQGSQRGRGRVPGSDWENGDSSRSEDDSEDDSEEDAEEGQGGVEEIASHASVAVVAANSGSSQGTAGPLGGEHAEQAAAADGGAPKGCPAGSSSPAIDAGAQSDAPESKWGKAAVKEEEQQLGVKPEEPQPVGRLVEKRRPLTSPAPHASEAAGFPPQGEGTRASDPLSAHDRAALKEEDCQLDADELLLVLPTLPGHGWGEPLLLGGCPRSHCLEKQGSNDVLHESFPPPAEPAEPLPEDLPFDVPDFLLAEAELPAPPSFYPPHPPDSAMGYQAGAAASHGHHSQSPHGVSYQHGSNHAGRFCPVSSPKGGVTDHQLVPLSVGDIGSGVFGAGDCQQPYPPSPHCHLSWEQQHAVHAVAGCTGGAQPERWDPERVVVHMRLLAPARHATPSAQHAQHASSLPTGSVFEVTMASAGSSTPCQTGVGGLHHSWLRCQHSAPGASAHAADSFQPQPAAPTAAPTAPACPLTSVFQPILSAGQHSSPFFPPTPKHQQQLDTLAGVAGAQAPASTSAGPFTTVWSGDQGASPLKQSAISLSPAAASTPHGFQGSSMCAARRCDSAAVLCDDTSASTHSVFLAGQGRQAGGVLKGRIIRADSALLLAAV